MSAVWRAARATVRRRRVQTLVIGLVVFSSTIAVVVAVGLLEAVSAPFDRAFAAQRGAHSVAVFDPARATPAQLARTADRSGVEAAAGPFAQASITVPEPAAGDTRVPGLMPGPLTVTGRADPGGKVDRVRLKYGRWATAPGEIVLNPQGFFSRESLGEKVTVPGGPTFTVVGFATTLSRSAEAWVTPAQAEALKPTARVMLYRFTDSATARDVREGLATATADLPARSLTGSQSYLTVKKDIGRMATTYLPFLTGFGVLGLAVAVLIVANVVSGAVIAGFRRIGVLKALGFTPNQVVAVHLVMVLVPAVVGCALGTAVGGIASVPLLDQLFQGMGSVDLAVAVSPWVYGVTLLGIPGVVAVAALVPALRAHGLSAAQAISAGSAPRSARGRRVQRRLSGTRLPRSVSLGLGMPFTRPGRSALTLFAVVLGVTTVTLATGLTRTVSAYNEAIRGAGNADTVVHTGKTGFGEKAPRQDDAATEELLRSLPGVEEVIADSWIELHIAGSPQRVQGQFYRGGTELLSRTLVRGRWATGPGEIVATPLFLDRRGLSVGDRLTLTLKGKRAPVTIVGKTIDGDSDRFQSGWPTLGLLDPGNQANQYEVWLKPGTTTGAFGASVAAADPGLYPLATSETDSSTVLIVGVASVLTLLLGSVAALGVFNTVVLNTRERRRDLGMLKSIGMTPRQVVVMVVTSMVALGAVGGVLGVPLGIAVHRIVVPAMTDAAGVALPASMTDDWPVALLGVLVLAGVTLAFLGAAIPARSAGRLTIAKVLHNE
ncbi:FtsX-like permease family protein [Streptomyces sp. NPDC051018]|uniref:ABC transporter permease n=1 Tax=Streptomyces sp. NPDC051018 TaxID=3365639 RepID=UPI00378F91B1